MIGEECLKLNFGEEKCNDNLGHSFETARLHVFEIWGLRVLIHHVLWKVRGFKKVCVRAKED